MNRLKPNVLMHIIYKEKTKMSLGTILIIILILALVGIIPVWPHSQAWGYGPSGAVGLVVLILLILFLTGRL
jgi:hypothetical protein